LIAYRQVEILTDVPTNVILNDGIGSIQRLTITKANDVKKVRLRVGARHLVFEDPYSGPYSQETVQVLPLWKAAETIQVRKKKPTKDYVPLP
jgi:hypothetical protein